jgi:hypothetical protein
VRDTFCAVCSAALCCAVSAVLCCVVCRHSLRPCQYVHCQVGQGVDHSLLDCQPKALSV